MNQKHHASHAVTANIGTQRQEIARRLFARFGITLEPDQGQTFQAAIHTLLHFRIQQPAVLAGIGAHALHIQLRLFRAAQAVPPALVELCSQCIHGFVYIQHHRAVTGHHAPDIRQTDVGIQRFIRRHHHEAQTTQGQCVTHESVCSGFVRCTQVLQPQRAACANGQ